MSRTYARILSSIWADEDFTRLTSRAQWAYLMLLSQPKLSLVGVLDYMPRRWAGYCDLDRDEIQSAVNELESERFVVVDYQTEELLIRTFLKHDSTSAGAKYLKGVESNAGAIQSPLLRRLVQDALSPDTPCEPLSDTPSKDHPDETRDSAAKALIPIPKPNPEAEAEAVGSSRLKPDERMDLIREAATIVATRQGKGERGKGYLRASIEGIAQDWADEGERAHNALTERPSLTAVELAELLEPSIIVRVPMCGVCMKENPAWCGDECPLPPPKEGEFVDNVVGIGTVKKVVAR